MKAPYPNLESIELICLKQLNEDETFLKLKNDSKFFIPDITAQVFPQIWGSTNTAFDITANGHAAIGGCAMTTAYTVVMYESQSNIYFVFVNNKFCYKIKDPNEVFFEDLKNQNLTSLSKYEKYL